MKSLLVFVFIWWAVFSRVGQSLILHDVKVPRMVVIDQSGRSGTELDGDASNGTDGEDESGEEGGENGITAKVNVVHNYVASDDDDDDDDDVIRLDCDYEVESDSPPSYLVVKWFMDNKGIYQWIRGQQPSVFPHFRDHVGPITAVSSDPNYEFKGITLIRPSVQLSGVYKCVVQTDQDSKFKEKELQVIDLSNYTMSFTYDRLENGTQLNCSISNVFPRPTVHIEVGDEALYWETESRAFKLDNDYYEGSMSAIVSDLDDDDDVFNCYVTFGNLPLNLTTQLISSAMRTDSGSLCSIMLAPLILTSLLGYLKPFF